MLGIGNFAASKGGMYSERYRLDLFFSVRCSNYVTHCNASAGVDDEAVFRIEADIGIGLDVRGYGKCWLALEGWRERCLALGCEDLSSA